MARYHVSPETGKVGVCSAQIQCAFHQEGQNIPHFTNKAEALASDEYVRLNKENNENINSLKKTSRTKNTMSPAMQIQHNDLENTIGELKKSISEILPNFEQNFSSSSKKYLKMYQDSNVKNLSMSAKMNFLSNVTEEYVRQLEPQMNLFQRAELRNDLKDFSINPYMATTKERRARLIRGYNDLLDKTNDIVRKNKSYAEEQRIANEKPKLSTPSYVERVINDDFNEFAKKYAVYEKNIGFAAVGGQYVTRTTDKGDSVRFIRITKDGGDFIFNGNTFRYSKLNQEAKKI